jgi:hypothetical protein
MEQEKKARELARKLKIKLAQERKAKAEHEAAVKKAKAERIAKIIA